MIPPNYASQYLWLEGWERYKLLDAAGEIRTPTLAVW